MSWQQPQGGSGFNPNAQLWGQQQGQQGQQGAGRGGYGQQQQYGGGYQQGGYQQGGYQQGGYQQGGYGQQQQQYYQGGYYQQGGYQQGGYGGGYQQGGYGGYQQQQGGYQQGGYQQGGYQQHQQSSPASQQPAQQEAAPAPAAQSVAEAKPSALQLGGASGKKDEIVMPKKGKAKKLTLGGPKKDEEPKKDDAPAAAGGDKPAASPTECSPAAASPTEEKKDKKDEVVLKKKSDKTYVRDPRPHFNVVFCGHVDAGKSTINGDLLIASGAVDDREMQKLTREAEQNHREGWEKAYVFDLSEEERAKGKTHETGAAYFETKDRRLTVLDAPGHKAFVPSMIGGATQADLAVMVISARRGEFETGFEGGGQTREHTILLRTCGVKYMICVINKMDDCDWDKERYDEILGKLVPFFKQNGYAEKAKNLTFMPVSGLSGFGLAKPVGEKAPWYTGPHLLEHINGVKLPETRTDVDPLCIPVVSAIRDDGKLLVCGKIESGSVAIGDEVTLLPAKTKMVVEGILVENTEIEKAYVGDNVHLRVKGVDESDFRPGYVITQPGESAEHAPLRTCEFFQATIMVLDVDNIMSNGTKVVMHAHSLQEEVTIDKILATCDPKTLKPLKKEPAFAKAGDAIIARLEVPYAVTLEEQAKFDKMGRFMLRDKGRTIAIGRVTKLYESTHESLKTKQ